MPVLPDTLDMSDSWSTQGSAPNKPPPPPPSPLPADSGVGVGVGERSGERRGRDAFLSQLMMKLREAVEVSAFNVAASRTLPRPRSGGVAMTTPKEGSSRPSTQGGSRLLVSREREPTIAEGREDDRKYLYSPVSRLKSRGKDGGVLRQFPLRSLAELSVEERSRLAMECSLCQATFTEPKVLCCRRLCKKCLQNHIDIVALDGHVPCLICRANVPVPDSSRPRDTWADQFRTDLFLQRLQEVSSELKEKHDCHVCDSSRGKKTPAAVYCFDCDTYYCTPCNDMHLQLRGLTSHSTAAVAELHPRDMLSRRRVFCQRHKDRYIERFCKLCRAMLCQVCVDENHRKCNVISTQQVALEKRRQLEDLKEEFDAAIRKAEEEDEMLRDRGSRMQNRVDQRKEDIEAAFNRIEAAVAERKQKLLSELSEDSLQDGRGQQSKQSQLQALVSALKDSGALAEEMVGCGSDRDLIESADDIVRQCLTLSEVTHNTARLSQDRPLNMARVDRYSVNTFLTLLAALGEDVQDQVVAFKTRQMGLRVAEDKEVPSIKDILLLDNNTLLAVDNANKSLKAIVPRQGGGHQFLHLAMKTRPWGVTLTQPNVVAVSGHQCLYIVTVTDQDLSLQTTVRTRRDYWSITSLSPINIAGACKFPPSIDIVDITGRRLRTIEGERDGTVLFKQPSCLASLRGDLLVTDRQNRKVICLDQAGQVKFRYSAPPLNKDEQRHLRGVCTDEEGRVYVVDGGSVLLLSAEGKQLCTLLSGLPDPRALSVGRNNILAVSMDGRGVAFFILTELKGPY